jgi:hypothetical protein
VAAAKAEWVKDHPGHSPDDYELWGSCSATDKQERHWHDWTNDFQARYRDREPLAQELTEAHQENIRLDRRLKELEAKLARRKPAPASSEIDALRQQLAAAKAKPAPAAKGEPAMTLEMISTKSGREQAEIFIR